MARMSDTRQGPQVVYPAPGSGDAGSAPGGEPAYAPSGEPAYAVSGEPAYALSGEPAYAVSGEPAYAVSGEPAYALAGTLQSADRPAGSRPGSDAGRVLRVLALIAVAVGVTALTAAACVLSYSSVHHLATQAGVHGRLARIYPLIFDAVLVVAGCSVLALRGAGLVSRLYSWLCMLVLLAALAAGGVLHAAAVKIPHKLAAVVAAIVPWALVLIAFGLLIALLRYARLRRLGKRNGMRRVDEASRSAEVVLTTRAPVAERERQAMAQRPLIPGLPPRQSVIAAPETPLTEEPGDAPGAREPADAPTVDTGVEPPTVPNAAPVAVAAPGMAPAMAASAVDTVAEDKPGVRRAEMQLRARTQKQPEEGAAAIGLSAPGWPTPFMPQFGQQSAPAQQDKPQQHEPQHDEAQHDEAQHDEPQQDEPRQDEPRQDLPQQDDEPQADQPQQAGAQSSPGQLPEEEPQPAEPLPKRVPGQQPVISGFGPPTGQTDAGQEPATEPATTASVPDDAGDASMSHAAPTSGEEEEEPGLPAFRRTRSSPTPPQEDQERS